MITCDILYMFEMFSVFNMFRQMIYSTFQFLTFLLMEIY